MRRLLTKILVGISFLVSAAVLPSSALAAEQTTKFTVENMTCALCPITVRKAMENVPGVESVEVDFGAQTATVVYDSALTTPEAIGAASKDAGYPAKPVGEAS